ncbi:MAG: hypothetical protein NT007_05325 [Candidatus Kapabacteria bacterium]|nr:hypothetical protein [Candidatus Kapabacteria bacterium]
MPNFSVQRDYRINDSDLTNFTQHVCDSMDRDITNFGVFGITSLAVDNLQTLCDAFEIFPTDEYVWQEAQSATEAKDALILEMRGIVKQMAMRVELKWGKASPKYRSLGTSDLGSISDELFLTRARMVFAFMTENKVALAAEGLTDAMLDDMEEKIQALDDAKRYQLEKVSYRAEKTVERVNNGNELYGFVSKYCEVGKRIWDGINPAFFNDYVIYGGTAPGLGKVQNLTANWVSPDSVVHLTWDAVSGASFYEIYHCAVDFGLPSVTFEFWIELPNSPQGVAFTADKRNYYKVRAKNGSIVGDFSDEAWTEVVISV